MKNKVLKSSLPNNSILNLTPNIIDFCDSYESNFLTNEKPTINTIGKAFFTSAPRWIDQSLQLRNKIVKNLGLKINGSKEEMLKDLESFDCQIGQQIGLFKVFDKNDNEIILGEDDKHLDFKISLFLETFDKQKHRLIISTTVKFNNKFGRFYFKLIKPFHRIVVPVMLKGIIKQLNEN
jgi:hypothetical protein